MICSPRSTRSAPPGSARPEAVTQMRPATVADAPGPPAPHPGSVGHPRPPPSPYASGNGPREASPRPAAPRAARPASPVRAVRLFAFPERSPTRPGMADIMRSEYLSARDAVRLRPRDGEGRDGLAPRTVPAKHRVSTATATSGAGMGRTDLGGGFPPRCPTDRARPASRGRALRCGIRGDEGCAWRLSVGPANRPATPRRTAPDGTGCGGPHAAVGRHVASRASFVGPRTGHRARPAARIVSAPPGVTRP